MAELWLDEPFASAWRGKDAFQIAFAIEGQEHRALEQRQTVSFELEGKRYFIKRHRGATWREIFKNLLQLRLPVVSAYNEWRALTKLEKIGIAAPRLRGYGRRGLLPSQFESFLITEDIGPHVTLEDYCRLWPQNPPSVSEKRSLITQVADMSRTLHGNGLCHRDYYLCHLLKVEGKEGLTLIDLHRALSKQHLGQRWIIKDIAGLYFSSLDIGLTQRDRLRFIERYSGRSWKQELRQNGAFWEAVKARGDKLYAREQRRAAR